MAKLSDEIRIGGKNLKNRLVMPPMATRKAADGRVTDEMIEFYRERAKYGKIGLIIAEHSYIHREGKAHVNQLSMAEDADLPGLNRLTDAVHGEGAAIIAQINHAGAAARSSVTGMNVVGPCADYRPGEDVPTALSRERIREITDWFAAAALRAEKAGFDGVEIHSAHGYLLSQFFSPLSNKRTDEYGSQSVENRIRFQCEALRAVKQTVKSGFPVAVRLGGCDYTEGGSTVENCARACRMLEESGAELIDLSGGMCGYTRPGHSEPGYFRNMSLAVKAAVSVPVLLTGGVTALKQAEELVETNCADLVGVGRALYADPHWAD